MDGVILNYEYDSHWNHKTGSWSNELFGGSFVMKSLTGTLCKETASGMLELSTFPPFPVLLLNEYIDLITSHFRLIKTDYPYDDTTKVTKNLSITTMEKTIIDMLEDGEEDLLKLKLIDFHEYKDDIIF